MLVFCNKPYPHLYCFHNYFRQGFCLEPKTNAMTRLSRTYKISSLADKTWFTVKKNHAYFSLSNAMPTVHKCKTEREQEEIVCKKL